MDTLAEMLIQRVDELVPVREAAPRWGSPLLSTTPRSLAIENLAARTDALEQALREIAVAVRELALEVERLSARS
jgi:hypothetical protein